MLLIKLVSHLSRFESPIMPLARSLISAALLLCAGQARAISFDCVPPVFPARQASQEDLRRVEQQVRAWNACYAAFSATHRNIDAARQDHEVATELEKWSASMRSAPRAAAEPADKRKVEELMLRQAEQQPAVYSRDRR